MLSADPALANEIETKIRERLKNGAAAEEVVPAEENVTDSGILITEDFNA